MIIEHAVQLVDTGAMALEDRRYPITRIEKYTNVTELTGVGVGGADMSPRYAVMLRNEFVPAGKRSGDEEFPLRDIYFKVLPLGTADIPGVLIGYPTLDCPPFGLGWQRREYTHFFTSVQIHLPRAELQRRKEMSEELVEWKKEGTSEDAGKDKVLLNPEQCNLLREAARHSTREYACAYYEGPPFTLGPQEQAMIPAVWCQLPPSGGAHEHKDFLCVGLEGTMATEFDVVPGVCAKADKEMMLCVSNSTFCFDCEPSPFNKTCNHYG